PFHVLRSENCHVGIAISSAKMLLGYVRLTVQSTLFSFNSKDQDSVVSPSDIPLSTTLSSVNDTLILPTERQETHSSSAVRSAVKIPWGAKVLLLFTKSFVTFAPDV